MLFKAFILVLIAILTLNVDVLKAKTTTRSCTQIVLVGATGDLAKKYLWKGLFELYRKHTNQDSIINVFGAARELEGKGKIQLRDILSSKIDCDSNVIEHDKNCETLRNEFIENTYYYKLKKDEDYKQFCEGLNDLGAEELGRIFYLSVPPFAYGPISNSINKHCRPRNLNGKDYLKVVVEKPFGADLESARSLAKELERYFDEDEIYRVDHYLGKIGVSQILNFRFEYKHKYGRLWNKDHIKSVEVSLKEKDDCRGRTEFYNKYGVIRDVMQNHMTEIMALVAMEMPNSISNMSDISRKKIKFLKEIESIGKLSAIIGQYQEYQKHCETERGTTDPIDRTTPTFAGVLLHSENARWKNVPFVFVSGKQLNERTAYVRIIFNDGFHFGSINPNTSCHPRQIIFHIQGGELGKPSLILSKSLPHISKFSNWIPLDEKPSYLYGCPGSTFQIYQPQTTPDAYTVLIDAVYQGQKEHFIGTSDLLASWRIWSPLVNILNSVPPLVYSRNNLEILDFTISGKKLELINSYENGKSCSSDATCDHENVASRYLQSRFRGNTLITGKMGYVVRTMARDIFDKAMIAVIDTGQFHIALSGGSTPFYLFEQLAFFTPEFPWHSTHIWFVDERCKDITDKQSNYDFIYKNLLQHVLVPSTNIHPLPVRMEHGLCSSLDRGVYHYEAIMKSSIDKQVLDYVLLGVGTDGHVASIFPNTNFQAVRDWLSLSVSKTMEPTGERMTMTFEVINQAKNVGILILGEKKAEVVERVANLQDKEVLNDLPVSAVDPLSANLVWYIDDKALQNVKNG